MATLPFSGILPSNRLQLPLKEQHLVKNLTSAFIHFANSPTDSSLLLFINCGQGRHK
jgi:hypothetical protein